MKLHRSPNSAISDTYEFKMGMFLLVTPEEFLQIITNYYKVLTCNGTSMPVGIFSFMLNLLFCESLREY